MAILHGNPASYFGEGTLAARPTPTNVAPHTVARYHATDTGDWYSWNGTAWELEGATPPANPSGGSTAQSACNIAGYIANSIINESMQQAIASIQAGQSLLTYGLLIIGLIPGSGLVVDALIGGLYGLYNAINGGTLSDYQAAVADPSLWSLITCSIYVNTEADGGLTEANFPGVVTSIGDITYTHPDVITAIVSFLNTVGYAGLAKVQPAGALATYDCTSCGTGVSTGPGPTTIPTNLIVTDGTHTVRQVDKITVAGAVVSGTAPDATVTVSPSLELTDGITDLTGVNKITTSAMSVGGTSAAATLSPVLATDVNPGIVEPDGTSLTVNESGIISASLATSSTPGIVQPDDTTIDVSSSGVISAVNQGVSVTDGTTTVAGATSIHAADATVSGTSPNATITPKTATTAQLGISKPDGSTIDIAAGVLSVPLATTAAPGIVQPDGTTVDVAAGVISVPLLSASTEGLAKPDGTSIIAAAPGLLTVPLATAGSPGLVEPDNSTIHVNGSGVISAAAAGVTATDGTTSVAGATQLTFADATVSGTTPDATITPKTATSSQLGVVKVDGTTITAAAGVISATATGLPSGTTGEILHNESGTWSGLAAGAAGDVLTSDGSDVSYQPARIAGAANGTIAGTRHEIDVTSADGDVLVSATDDSGADAVHIDLALGAAVKSVLGGLTKTYTFVSDTSVKALDLWNGSSNDAPPANWQTSGFSDSSWGTAAVGYDETGLGLVPIGSSHIIWPKNPEVSGALAAQALFRQHISLPAGTIIAASLRIAVDSSTLGLYINGNSLGTPADSGTWASPGQPDADVAATTVAISPGDLTAGATNILAQWTANESSATDPNGGVVWVLSVVYASGSNVGVTPSGTVEIAKNGTAIGTEHEINFIEGVGVTLTVVDNPADARVDVTIDASSGGSGGALAIQSYAPSSDTVYQTTSTSFVDVDATNAALTFDVPSSGNVLVRASFSPLFQASGASGYFNLRDSGGDIAGTSRLVTVTVSNTAASLAWYLTGLTPGSYTVKLGARTNSGSEYQGIAWGPTFGALVMEAWGASSGSSGITVEGPNTTVTDVSTLDFTSGATVADAGSGKANVDIAGGAGLTVATVDTTVSGVTKLSLSGVDLTDDGGGQVTALVDPTLDTSHAELAINTTCPNGANTTLLTIMPGAGVWLVWAGVALEAGAAQNLYAYITDSASGVEASAVTGLAGLGDAGSLALAGGPVTLAASDTIALHVQVEAGTADATAIASTTTPALSKYTYLRALRIAPS